VLWGKVGLVRTRDSLVSATGQLSRWERAVSRPFASRRDLEVKNMVQVAHCIAEAALWRDNSVGAHYRADFPDRRRTGWKQHSQIRVDRTAVGSLAAERRPRLVSLPAATNKPA